ncbi:MAG: hypothetical protein MRZ79_20575 [Bacteroidia bacterium]|nr:hypothetical protein [Bacteroidia bacterium]
MSKEQIISELFSLSKVDQIQIAKMILDNLAKSEVEGLDLAIARLEKMEKVGVGRIYSLEEVLKGLQK